MKANILKISFYGVSLVLIVLGFKLYSQITTSPDQQLFDYVAWNILNQGLLYKDVFEINFPIKPAIHMAALQIFGDQAWSFRTFDYLMNIGVSIAGYVFLRYVGFGLGAIVFVPVYLFSYVTSGAWFAGQIDHTGHALLFVSLIAIAAAKRQEHGVLLAVVAGIFSALAFLLKPTMLAFPTGVFVALIALGFGEAQTRRGLQLALIFGTGFLAVLVGFAIIGALTGQLAGFWQQTVLFNLQVYGAQESAQSLTGTFLQILRNMVVIAVFGMAGFAVMGLQGGYRSELLLFALLLGAILVSYLYQNKGFGYHLGGLVLVFAFGTSALIDLTGRWGREHTTRRIVGLVASVGLVLLISAALGRKVLNLDPDPIDLGLTHEDQREILLIIEQKRRPDSSIVIWGRQYQIGMLAGLPTAWPFINAPLREEGHRMEGWYDLAQAELDRTCPQFVLANTSELYAPSKADDTTLRTLLIDLVAAYQPAYQAENVTLYERAPC